MRGAGTASNAYQDRLARARVTHGKAESRLRAADMVASIAAALDEFEAPLARAADAIARQAAGRDMDASDAQDVLRALGFQRDMLLAALAQAARADQMQANRTDPRLRAAAVEIAKAQQAADAALAVRIEDLLARVQRDFARAGRAKGRPKSRPRAPARRARKAARPGPSRPPKRTADKKKSARPKR